jgi:predicted Zn-dependent peptidase
VIYKNSKEQGYNLHVIATDKFKTTRIEIKFSDLLNRETASVRALLTLMLMNESKGYKTQQELAQKLEGLYGASLSSSVNSVGVLSIFELKMSVISDAYLNEDVFEEGLEVLKDRLFDPIFNEEDLRVQKEELKQRIRSVYDNKTHYSLKRLLEIVGENKPFSVDVNGYLDEIDLITLKDLETEHQRMLNEGNIDFFIVGNVSEKELNLIKKSFVFNNNYQFVNAAYTDESALKADEIFEEQEINQGKLNLAFRSPGNILSDNYYAGVIFNTIFGGMSTSKLFMNVREKHSLAYSVSSKFEGLLGFNIVHTGINAKDLDKTREVITEQLDEMKNGQITDSELELAKKTIINGLKQGTDTKAGIVRFYYSKILTGRHVTVKDIENSILKVTKEDVVAFAKGVKQEKVYFLHGGM